MHQKKGKQLSEGVCSKSSTKPEKSTSDNNRPIIVRCPYCESYHEDHEKCYFKQFCMTIEPEDIIVDEKGILGKPKRSRLIGSKEDCYKDFYN